jgi:hypothetical protein
MTISYLRTLLYITNNDREDGTGNCLCIGSKVEDISLTLSVNVWKSELTLGIYSLSFRKQAGVGFLECGKECGKGHILVRSPDHVLRGYHPN